MGTTNTIERKDVATSSTDCDKVISILELIIDEEASDEDRNYFFKHIEACSSCFDTHNHHKMLKDFLQRNVKRKDVPANLIASIKNIVQETV